MYEYGNARYGCGCNGSDDYRADGDALARLARAAEREDCGAEQERHADHGRGHLGHQNCGTAIGNGGVGKHCSGCSICHLVNCVRRTICGCGCGCRRGRNR